MTSPDLRAALRRAVKLGLLLAEAWASSNPSLLLLLCWLKIAVVLVSHELS